LPTRSRTEIPVSKAWLQAVAIVILFGFFILGFLTYRTYTGEAPIPARVVDPAGGVLFTHDDILGGQQVFLRNGLEYRSIFGHGAYLGPDFTDYLRRAATSVLDSYGGPQSDRARGQTIAVMFLVAVGFWNFLGAGVFGFLINLPVVSYYEIGTALTANHGHAAMMGVYGMLAVGLALFCIRYLIPEKRWSDRAARLSFWSLNVGLA
jgi:nitric oxide reductase large subunit